MKNGMWIENNENMLLTTIVHDYGVEKNQLTIIVCDYGVGNKQLWKDINPKIHLSIIFKTYFILKYILIKWKHLDFIIVSHLLASMLSWSLEFRCDLLSHGCQKF